MPIDSANFANFALLQLFEGLKAYRGVDGKIRLFRPQLNIKRLLGSAERVGLPVSFVALHSPNVLF